MGKKRMILVLFALAMMFTGCGTSNMSEAAYDAADNNAAAPSSNAGSSAESVAENDPADELPFSSLETQEDFDMNLEMLIYNCDLTIDTLDFSTSVSDFKKALSAAGGFVEQESYYDNNYGGGYYVEDDKKSRIYEATVRIPSGKYADFLDGAGSLGDIRRQTAYVQNVSQEYTDLQAALEVYEAKEARYINLLSTITDDQYAVEVERELTDIQIEIAQLKTRMNKINTDVAYSYINIEIQEVKEYTKEKNEDTFGQRMLNRIQDSWSVFLSVLEALLVILIMIFPYLVILIILLLVILLIHKRNQKKRPKVTGATPTYSAGWQNNGTLDEQKTDDQNKAGD